MDRRIRNGPPRSRNPTAALRRSSSPRAIEFRALGAEKFFPFTGKDDRGGERSFGMLDRNDAPLRSMAAYAYLPRALAHREYVGDLKIDGVMRSRVFTDGRDAVACLYAGGERSPLKLRRGWRF